MDPAALTLRELRDAIAGGDLSAEDAARACLDRIDALDGGPAGLNAFAQVFHDEAIEAARRIDESGAEKAGPLAGVPIAVKDNICFAQGRTTCGSRILEGYESPYTATAVQRLLDAGATVIGKTNLDEFGMGSSTEHSIHGAARNPWDRERVAGGSSGGSAAAVAARLAPAALGSDTGGSIRQPAALCGIVGMKPTYGLVSRFGLAAFASSLDQIGPLARTVDDVALILDAICGRDRLDATSVAGSSDAFSDQLDSPPEKLRIGVPAQALSDDLHPGVRRAMEGALEIYKGRGAEVIEIDLPHIEYAIAAYYVICGAEASSNLARYDGVRYGRRATPRAGDDLAALYSRSRSEGLGEEVQRRIMLGTFALSSGYHDAYYTTALKARRRISEDFAAVFGDGENSPRVDVVAMPTTPNPAFRLGEKTDDPLAMYLEDFFTVCANMAGLPAISIPAGFAAVGADAGADAECARLPVGLQLLGPAFQERRLLQAARLHEIASDWNQEAPAV